MFQNTNQNTNKKAAQPAKAQPTTKALTQQEAMNELYKKPFEDSPFWLLLPSLGPVWLGGGIIIFLFIAAKRGWLQSFFGLIARILGR